MNANAMKSDRHGAKSRDELIALARAIRAEFQIIHGHMARILSDANQKKAA